MPVHPSFFKSLDAKMKEFDEKQKTFEEAKDQVLALRDTPAPAGGGPVPSEPKAADAPDWTQVYDEASQSYYYFNEKTQETSWSAPGKDYESDGYDTTGSRGTAVDYDTDAYDNMGGDGGEWSEQYDENAQATYVATVLLQRLPSPLYRSNATHRGSLSHPRPRHPML